MNILRLKQLPALIIQKIKRAEEMTIPIIIILGLLYLSYIIFRFLTIATLEWMRHDYNGFMWFITYMLHGGWIIAGIVIYAVVYIIGYALISIIELVYNASHALKTLIYREK